MGRALRIVAVGQPRARAAAFWRAARVDQRWFGSDQRPALQIIASEIGSFFGGIAARSDDDRAYLAARQSVLSERESSATGVNTDTELQALMLVEQTYAANARVLSVIDELMKLLLR